MTTTRAAAWVPATHRRDSGGMSTEFLVFGFHRLKAFGEYAVADGSLLCLPLKHSVNKLSIFQVEVLKFDFSVD